MKKVGTRNALLSICVSFLVVAVASLVFAFRYQPAFTHPNFYAEDGKVFVSAVLSKAPIHTIFADFNGYLVVGQFLLAELAVATQNVSGASFEALPLITAVLSVVFLGTTVSLPFLLLRKHIDWKTSLVAVFFGSFAAMPASDYAIIGTLGNLKFAFIYWAFVLIIYRNYNYQSKVRCAMVDFGLLFSILTYAPAAALLPFALWPYRMELRRFVRERRLNGLPVQLLTLTALAGLVAVYLVTVTFRGIPNMPGYLDTPFDSRAIFKLVFHSTWYAWLFPIVQSMRDSVVVGVIILAIWLALKNKSTRFVALFAAYAITVATLSFVVNRPGISDFFLTYDKGPDQFFYAQRLLFTLATIIVVRSYAVSWPKHTKYVIWFGLGLYCLWSYRYTGSFGANYVLYSDMPTIHSAVPDACRSSKNDVTIQLYPAEKWDWTIPRTLACRHD